MFSAVFRTFLLSMLMLCSAAVVSAADAWLRVETANFEVVGNAAEADVRAVAERLERFREAISKVIAVRSNAVKTRVVVFKDDASFRPFKPKKADGTPDDLVAGLFQPGEDINYIAIPAGGADLSTIYHEYTHDVLNASFGRTEIPAWLNEGLAEYFQTFRIVDERTAVIGEAPRTHIALLQRGPLIPWDEFFAVDNHSLQERGHSRTLFYAQAWAAIQYLLQETQKGAARDLMHNRGFQGSLEPWMLKILSEKVSRTQLDSGVKALIANTEFQPRKIDFVGAPPLFMVEMKSIAEPRANAYLGDLLYHLKEYQDAEKYLKAALAAEPNLPAANASLGMVKLRQRKFSEAKRLLEGAVAGDADNHLVHFYYAYLLTRENMNEAGLVTSFPANTANKIRDSLRRAIRLNDRFAESYRLFAFTALVTNEGLEEALAGLKKAESLRPGDTEIGLMVPQILLRQEKADEARSSAERIFRTTSDARAKKEAAEIVKAANELTASLRGRQIVISGTREPIIYQRKDLTEEQLTQLEQERVVNNVNLLIERPRVGELQTVGRLGKVACVEDRIIYSFKTDDGELKLGGRRFDDLRLKVLIEGTRSFAFRCDAKVTDELAVITYRPKARPGAGSDGELISISFVPSFFKLRTLDEIAKSPNIIVQGGPASDLGENEKTAASERAEMERVMRETQIRDVEERLRQPEAGEIRLLAIPQKLECSAGRYLLTANNSGAAMLFSAAIANRFEVNTFNSEAGIVEIGCRTQLPSLPAVITFRQNGNDRELVAVEFVPSFYKLP